jgi:hypothetical protein
MRQAAQPAADRESLAGLVERVTFHDSGFCVLRVKTRGHHDLITVTVTVPIILSTEQYQEFLATGLTKHLLGSYLFLQLALQLCLRAAIRFDDRTPPEPGLANPAASFRSDHGRGNGRHLGREVRAGQGCCCAHGRCHGFDRDHGPPPLAAQPRSVAEQAAHRLAQPRADPEGEAGRKRGSPSAPIPASSRKRCTRPTAGR